MEHNEDFDFNSISLCKVDSNSKFTAVKKEEIVYINRHTQWPIDVRILINKSNSEEAKPFHKQITHQVTVNDSFKQFTCPRTFSKTCPICESFFESAKKVRECKESGTSPDKATLLINSLFKPKTQFITLLAVRGSDKLHWLAMSSTLAEEVFGCEKKGKDGAVEELMKSFQVSAFNPFEQTGWIKLKKTGEGLSTIYSASLSEVTKLVGKKKESELLEEMIPQNLLEKVKTGELPKVSEKLKKYLWTDEEFQDYAESLGSKMPEKFLGKKYMDSAGSIGAILGDLKVDADENVVVPNFNADPF